MTTPWYQLTNFIDLQRKLIVDLSNNPNTGSLTLINRIDSSLNELHDAVQNADKSVMADLTQQKQVKEILEREEQRLNERKQAIQHLDDQQKRMVDLTNNAVLRNKAMNQMYLVVVIALLLFVGVKLVAGFIPEIVSDLLVILIVSGAIVMIAYMYFDYARRNNMNYNEIDLGEPAHMVPKPETNKSDKNLLDLRLNGCIGEGCCAPGTTFNEKYSICVPNASDNKAYFIGSKTMELTSNCTGGNTYSETELACVPATQGFTTMINTSVQPYAPTEIVDYTTYK